MTNPVIPVEAVEAAAKVAVEQLAMYTFPANFNGGNAFHEEVAQRCGPLIAKAVLEAAAPYLMAQAWDEGREADDFEVSIGMDGNPYRKTPHGDR
jgi:hypothetical protein